MGGLGRTVNHMCSLIELKEVRDWGKKNPNKTVQLNSRPTTKTLLSENPNTHWRVGETIQKHKCLSKPTANPMASWSTQTGQSQLTGLVWGFTQDRMTVHEDTCTYTVTTLSLTGVEAGIHAIQWLASQSDTQITQAIVITDSLNLLQKVESQMGSRNGNTPMHSLKLQRFL